MILAGMTQKSWMIKIMTLFLTRKNILIIWRFGKKCKIQSLPGRKSACASYQSCNIVCVCNNMEIRGSCSVIFQFISATNFQKNYHTVKVVLITNLAVTNYSFLIMAVTYPVFFWADQYTRSRNYNTSRNNM